MEKDKYELSGEDKASLGLASIIFMLGLFFGAVIAFMVCLPMQVHAEELSTTNEYYMEYWNYAYDSSSPFQVYRFNISTDMRFCLLETSREHVGEYPTTCYIVVCSDFDWQREGWRKEWTQDFFCGYKDSAMTELGFEMSDSSYSMGYLVSDVKTWDAEKLVAFKDVIACDITDTNLPIFTSVDDAVHYIETGYNPLDISEKFTDVYDPSMPVPQLGNLTHAGFTVVDAPEGNYYLQLQIESTVYGMKFKDTSGGVGASYTFERDNNWIYAQQTRNLGSWDVPISNQLTYNLAKDWDYDNVLFLSENSYMFFSRYPYEEELPGWSFWKHGIDNKIFKDQNINAQNAYVNRDDELLSVSYLNKSVLPTTKYYVRYVHYDVSESGEYVPRYSQWMSYKVGFGLLTISPVVGDASGKPLDTDPVTGKLDENGNYIGNLGSGLNSGFDINTDNPIEMLADVISWLTSLPELFGDFSLFLQDAFAFVPSYIWRIFASGIAICVLCVILKYA